jgi:hypothetical protein
MDVNKQRQSPLLIPLFLLLLIQSQLIITLIELISMDNGKQRLPLKQSQMKFLQQLLLKMASQKHSH